MMSTLSKIKSVIEQTNREYLSSRPKPTPIKVHVMDRAKELSHYNDDRFLIRQEDFETMDLTGIDCVVTAGNSYGHMTGTFDRAVVERLGLWTQRQVLREINTKYLGELPVGRAILVGRPLIPEVGDLVKGETPIVMYTPTMRVPTGLPSDTDVPYVAMLATLQCLQPWMREIVVPLFGAGTGGVEAKESFRQIIMAVERYYDRPVCDRLFTDGYRMHEEIMGYPQGVQRLLEKHAGARITKDGNRISIEFPSHYTQEEMQELIDDVRSLTPQEISRMMEQ